MRQNRSKIMRTLKIPHFLWIWPHLHQPPSPPPVKVVLLMRKIRNPRIRKNLTCLTESEPKLSQLIEAASSLAKLTSTFRRELSVFYIWSLHNVFHYMLPVTYCHTDVTILWEGEALNGFFYRTDENTTTTTSDDFRPHECLSTGNALHNISISNGGNIRF